MDCKITAEYFINKNETSNEQINFKTIPTNLPEDIKFLVKEFQNTSFEILEKAEKYSPYTHSKIYQLVDHFKESVLEDDPRYVT